MDNLSSYQFIEFVSAKDPESLKLTLANIKLPFNIVSMYFANGRHIAWIVPSVPVKKRSKQASVKVVRPTQKL